MKRIYGKQWQTAWEQIDTDENLKWNCLIKETEFVEALQKMRTDKAAWSHGMPGMVAHIRSSTGLAESKGLPNYETDWQWKLHSKTQGIWEIKA